AVARPTAARAAPARSSRSPRSDARCAADGTTASDSAPEDPGSGSRPAGAGPGGDSTGGAPARRADSGVPSGPARIDTSPCSALAGPADRARLQGQTAPEETGHADSEHSRL